MLTLFKKLLGKQPAPQPKVVPRNLQIDAAPAMPTVEVAHLSLTAIVARLPEDLQALVRQQPEASSTVALPIPTILKQLPSGAVKISLATLHRQAPAGIFAPLPPGDKRMVSVPLAEIFRHVSPLTLRRRLDQRTINLPSGDFDLFGNSSNPYEIARPGENEQATLVIDDPQEPAIAPRFSPTPPSPGLGARVIAPPADYFAPTPHRVAPAPPAPAKKPAAPKSDLPPLRMPLEPLTTAWPAEIKSELADLNGSASVLLPVDDLTAGLARGRVTFTWGELRSFIEPALESASCVDESTPLTLPLKIVAPAFLAASKQPKQEVKKVTVAADIPAIFSDNRAPVAPAEPAPVEDSAPTLAAPAEEKIEQECPQEGVTAQEEAPVFQVVSDPAPVSDVAPESATETAPIADAGPIVEAAPAGEIIPVAEAAPEPICEPDAVALALVPEPAAAEACPHPPAPAEGGAPVSAGKPPGGIGSIFGEPDRDHWTPAEIISRLPQLPGVAGGVIALQEGLLVAHSLPEDVKSEVVAAFLPQLFARLNQYAGEMKLGDVDDLLFTTRGAHCQIYRLGILFFAVLGKPGDSLPWHELRLIAEELAKQSQPS